MPAHVSLRDVRKSFGETEIIKGVNFDIEPSEFVVLVGPSGCGKSTLLRMIAGLETVSSGDIKFDDDVVNGWSPAQRRVGMVFQSYALYPHMSVEENVGFGLKIAKKDKEERKARVDEALKVLQLDHLRDSKPSQLSGGQRQRVAIGRAIVRKPNVFLFDEPLSNLDTALRVQMRMEIGRLHRKLQNTVVYVTHDQVEAMTLADRIVVMEGGHVRQIGKPLELYEKSANTFVAGFLGTPKMAFLKARTSGNPVDGGILVDLYADQAGKQMHLPVIPKRRVSGDAIIGIRPEHFELASTDDAVFSGEVLELERLGSDTFAFVECPHADEPIAVRLSSAQSVQPGETIGLSILPEKVHLFDSEGEAVEATSARTTSESESETTQ